MRIIVFVLLLSLCGCTEEEVATFLVEAATGIETGDDPDDCVRVKGNCEYKSLKAPDSYQYVENRYGEGKMSCACVEK